MTEAMIRLNGTPAALAATVADLVERAGLGTAKGIAVAVNGTVVRRGAWPETRLAPGDAVELIRAMQGG